MTRADVFSISLKLAAVYVWVGAVGYLTQLGFFVRQLYEPDQPAFFVLMPFAVGTLLIAGLGAALFFSSSFLSARLDGGHAPASLEDRAGIGALGLRIAAILIFDRAISATTSALFQIRAAQGGGYWGVFWADVVVVGLLLAIGGWVFLCAEGIAARCFASGAHRPSESRYGRVQAVAFSVVGLWIIVAALPEAVRLALGMQTDWTQTIGTLLRVGLGVVLFFGGNTLAGLWLRVRTAVVEPKSRPV
jgi:hypothetical protein